VCPAGTCLSSIRRRRIGHKGSIDEASGARYLGDDAAKTSAPRKVSGKGRDSVPVVGQLRKIGHG
jgi:hypothetical protein